MFIDSIVAVDSGDLPDLSGLTPSPLISKRAVAQEANEFSLQALVFATIRTRNCTCEDILCPCQGKYVFAAVLKKRNGKQKKCMAANGLIGIFIGLQDRLL